MGHLETRIGFSGHVLESRALKDVKLGLHAEKSGA
jgi:hypothetical protein